MSVGESRLFPEPPRDGDDRTEFQRDRDSILYSSALQRLSTTTTQVISGSFPRYVEAELMDWVEDLTYAIHDAEDFYRAGIILLHSLRYSPSAANSSERDNFLGDVSRKKSKLPELQQCKDEDLDSILRELFALYDVAMLRSR